MSFLKIDNPNERDAKVKEFLQAKQKIKENNLIERVGNLDTQREYEKVFKPITKLLPEKDTINKTEQPLAIEARAINEPLAIEAAETNEDQIIGPMAANYLRQYLRKDADTTFGIYNKDNALFIGDSPIEVRDNDLIVKNKEYKGTEGLWELIVKNNPSKFNQEDKDNYEEIITQTNAFYQDNDPTNKRVKSSRSNKWKNFIKPIYEKSKETTGSGLLERFDLLMASKNAGNTGLSEELKQILNSLKMEGIINKEQYRYLLTII